MIYCQLSLSSQTTFNAILRAQNQKDGRRRKNTKGGKEDRGNN